MTALFILDLIAGIICTVGFGYLFHVSWVDEV